MIKETKNILWFLLIICIIVMSIIVFSIGDKLDNIIMVVGVFFEFIAAILVLHFIIVKVPLEFQLKGRKAFFSYVLAINFFALALSEFFLEPISINILYYLLLGVPCLYLALDNYTRNNEKFERDYDFLYTLIIALLIAIIKKAVEYFTASKIYTEEESITLLLNSFTAILACIIFYLIVLYMNNLKSQES